MDRIAREVDNLFSQEINTIEMAQDRLRLLEGHQVEIDHALSERLTKKTKSAS